MKIEFNSKSFDNLLKKMGAQLIEAKENSDYLTPLELEEIRSSEGKQINIEDISEDDERRAEEQVQKLTDSHVAIIDGLLKEKEEELMEI